MLMRGPRAVLATRAAPNLRTGQVLTDNRTNESHRKRMGEVYGSATGG